MHWCTIPEIGIEENRNNISLGSSNRDNESNMISRCNVPSTSNTLKRVNESKKMNENQTSNFSSNASAEVPKLNNSRLLEVRKHLLLGCILIILH